jgi:hypothetical protein
MTDMWDALKCTRILDEIRAERYRQECLKEEGKFPFTCASEVHDDTAKLPILAEEFGEVAREVCEAAIRMSEGNYRRVHEHRKNLRKELIQLAAVAAAWAESL